MAPASPFPEIPMDQVQTNEIEKAYHLLYKHIAREFVHWDDLRKVLTNGMLEIVTTVSGGQVVGSAGPYATSASVVQAQGKQVSTNFKYQENAIGLSHVSKHELRARGIAETQEAIVEGVSTALGV